MQNLVLAFRNEEFIGVPPVSFSHLLDLAAVKYANMSVRSMSLSEHFDAIYFLRLRI